MDGRTLPPRKTVRRRTSGRVRYPTRQHGSFPVGATPGNQGFDVELAARVSNPRTALLPPPRLPALHAIPPRHTVGAGNFFARLRSAHKEETPPLAGFL